MARKLLILFGAMALALALPAAAQAARFCVNVPQCGDGTHPTLQAALNAADATTEPDDVELGPGEYTGPFTADDDNPVEIVGAGHGTTVLTAAADATVISLAAPSSALRAVTVRPAAGIGVRLTSSGAPALLENMTVEMAGAGTGVQVASGPAPASAALRHVTLAGDGTGTGLDVTASAASTASATLSSSVISGFAVSISATDGACPVEPCTPGLATVITDYSAYDTQTVASTRPEGVSVTGGTPEPVTADPLLGDDLRPRFDSPLVDAADPASAGATDASGAPRVVDGDGQGGARSDIGALEYQRRAPQITAALAAPTSAAVGAPVTFSAAAIDPDGEAVGASWTFSDGTARNGFDVAHAFGTAGAASATVTVTDAAGVSATATVPVTISAAPAGGDPPRAGGDPAPVPRRSVIARVLPDALVLRADRRRDRRKPYRFRLRGRVVLPEGISTAGCAGGTVQLAIRAGKRRMTRSAKLAADCSFRATLKLGRKRARRVVVRPRFGGTGALTPLVGAKLKLRAG